jgi:site-specific DNA-methyltransferase (adenine-specific)
MNPYYEHGGITIYHGDCREIELSSIPLVITSPPYNCGRDYLSYDDSQEVKKYWEFTREWMFRIYGSLIIGGKLCLNITWWMSSRPKIDVPRKIKEIAEEIGFLFIDKIIWIKGNDVNANTSGTGWGSYMSPSSPSIRCATEPILVFAKEKRGRGLSDKGDISKENFYKWTIDSWFIQGEHNRNHPAVFPLEIPKRLIQLYTYPEETVLDPFMGSGTTLRAAKDLGRKAIGIEIEERYCEIAVRRLQQEVLF